MEEKEVAFLNILRKHSMHSIIIKADEFIVKLYWRKGQAKNYKPTKPLNVYRTFAALQSPSYKGKPCFALHGSFHFLGRVICRKLPPLPTPTLLT